jgi:hypothetical protein
LLSDEDDRGGADGLVEIGAKSFRYCSNSISKINIPTSLRRINDRAFWVSLRCPIRLNDGIESIGFIAFANCSSPTLESRPPLITVIPNCMLWGCKSTFSVEIPLTVIEIVRCAFSNCHRLRNVAFPPNADVGDFILYGATDLLLLFGSIAEIIRNLKL